MKKETFQFISKDGMVIYGYKWLPDNTEVIAVMHIIHGSVEHAMRYINFGQYLTDNGIAVYIHEQRGHGKTAGEIENLSYFSDEDNGWELALYDISEVIKIIKYDLPEKPLFVLGHSMGSFLARDLVSQNTEKIDGLIITGTIKKSFIDDLQFKIVGRYIKYRRRKKGRRYRDINLHKLVYEKLTLSRDEDIVKAYADDPYCGHTATLEYLDEMFKGMIKVSSSESFEDTEKSLPIYMLSGEKDKAGGKKVTTIYDAYKKAGVRDVEYKIYPEAYHEILNEINREEVYQDIYDWINIKM